MGYNKTTWVDGDNRYDIKTQASAVVSADIKLIYVGTAAGTAISSTVMNNIETGVEQACPTGTPGRHMSKWVPDGWLVRDGSTLNRVTYVDLFEALTYPQVFTVDIANTATFTLNSHGFGKSDQVRLSTTIGLPTGLSSSTTYYVITPGLTANAFQLATSAGGTAVGTSGTQSGVHTVRYFGVLGVGDGSTTFTLPDDRGEFERNWDGGRAVDVDRVFGSAQGDDVEPHNHSVYSNTNDEDRAIGVGVGGSYQAMGLGGPRNTVWSGAGYYNTNVAGTKIIQDSTGTETRPRNVTYLPTVRY